MALNRTNLGHLRSLSVHFDLAYQNVLKLTLKSSRLGTTLRNMESSPISPRVNELTSGDVTAALTFGLGAVHHPQLVT